MRSYLWEQLVGLWLQYLNFLQIYWGIIDKNAKYFKRYILSILFDIHVHFERIPPVVLTLSPHIVTILCVCVCVCVRIFRFYLLSKFQVCNTVLWPVVTILRIRSSALFHFIAESVITFCQLLLILAITFQLSVAIVWRYLKNFFSKSLYISDAMQYLPLSDLFYWSLA